MAGITASTALGAAGLATSLGGSLITAKAQKAQGKAAEAQAKQVSQNEMVAAEYEARQAEYLANQARAVSQKESFEQRRLAALMTSKALATAAGSGAGVSDPTVVDLLGNLYAEGAYRSALAMYEGEEQARSYTIAAQSRRLSGKSAASAALTEGRNTKEASKLSSMSTILSGGASLFSGAYQMFN